MIRCYARYNEVSENPDSDLPDANVTEDDIDVNEVEEVAPDIVGEVDEPFEDIDAYSTPINWSHANLTSCFSFG